MNDNMHNMGRVTKGTVENAEDVTVFGYFRYQIDCLKSMGRERTSETYRQALNRFAEFRNNADLPFHMLDSRIIGEYEAYLRNRQLCRNSISYYMRIMHSVYNKAVHDGIASRDDPFVNVYKGIDKTSKRALGMNDIRAIRNLDLSGKRSLEFARDMFLFSFYMRGMSFVDMAYLKKSDLKNGFVSYVRRKTGQQVRIRWEYDMQAIVDRHHNGRSCYLLSVIMDEDGTERRQYLNAMLQINRKLKEVGRLAGISVPLTMYVARHSWATVARDMGIPLYVISQGMGHDSERTTQIYLNTIIADRVDDANYKIISIL